MPAKADIKDAQCVSTNENLTLPQEQRVIRGADLTDGPQLGEKENFLPASYKLAPVTIEHKEGPAKTISGIVRTDR